MQSFSNLPDNWGICNAILGGGNDSQSALLQSDCGSEAIQRRGSPWIACEQTCRWIRRWSVRTVARFCF
jgi:hypothetical protein